MKLGDIIKNVAPAFLGGIIGQMISGGSRGPFKGPFESGGILFPGDDRQERYPPENYPRRSPGWPKTFPEGDYEIPRRRPTPPILLPEEDYEFPNIFGSIYGKGPCAKCREAQMKSTVMHITDPCLGVCSGGHPGPIVN